MTRLVAALCALLAFLAVPASAQTASNDYAICTNQTYALCAAATSFVYQELSYAKCVIKRGDSISAPPLTYDANGQTKNICDVNAAGVAEGYMMSTFSLPDEVRKGGSKALYTCATGATASYAQCDGGVCFKSSSGKYFPGVGKVAKDEIICSCPVTKPRVVDPEFTFQFVGPYPCRQEAFSACSQDVTNGSVIPVGSPPTAGRVLTELLYGHPFPINECIPQ